MHRKAAFALVAAAIFGLAGCSMFGSGETKTAAPTAAAAPADPYVLVAQVDRIEIGRTSNGIAVSAFGFAPGIGYGAPKLRPRRDGRVGPDGLLDFDFVAIPPNPGFDLGTGKPSAREIRADLLLGQRALRGARGIRVHAANGGLQVLF